MAFVFVWVLKITTAYYTVLQYIQKYILEIEYKQSHVRMKMSSCYTYTAIDRGLFHIIHHCRFQNEHLLEWLERMSYSNYKLVHFVSALGL